jgi:pyrroline-5-carboxylate reductase
MTIGFIGAGVMARALSKGIVDARIIPGTGLLCSAPSQQSGQAYVDLFPGSRWTANNAEVVRHSDLTVLAIKPQIFIKAVTDLYEASENKLFLSLMAGITINQICKGLHPTARVVRSMPNTPMQVGTGASVYTAGPNVTKKDLELVDCVLSSAGKAWPVEEAQINAVTALSGSGPAYVFHFIDALIRGGIDLGLPETLARDLAIQTVLGSAKLAARSSLSPMELGNQVKSPKGTTLAGCAVLEENNALNQLIARSMAAARNRAEELAQGKP